MAGLKAGDRVRISDRAATSQDAKSGLFYGHYRGLSGVVSKVFQSGEVAVDVDLDSLPEDVWKRHMTVRDQMRQRWLEGLSDDVRRRLTQEQKELGLRYMILVSAADAQKQRSARPKSHM